VALGRGNWWRPYRQLDNVSVTLVDLVPSEVNEQAAWQWLDDDERARARRFQHAGARRRYVLCRASLRSLLSSALNCRNQHLAFGAGEHGKPSATVNGHQTSVEFNVSHSGQHGLIALAPRRRVGVDVEERVPQRNLDVLVEAVLGPSERAEVNAVTRDRRLHLFLDLWTTKEALSKAHGMGLSLDVSGFEIPATMRNGSRRGVFRFPDMPDMAWQVENIGSDQFAAAIAYERDRRCQPLDSFGDVFPGVWSPGDWD